jgi:2-haloacid dehalogenase
LSAQGGLAPKAVLWDLGGVFLDWDPRYLYRKLFAGDEAAMEQFLTNICTPEWHAEQDLGRSVAEACLSLASSRPEHAAFILAWGERSEEMIGGVIEGTVCLLQEVKAGGSRCYALSNMEPENWQKRRQAYEFISWFDGWFISGLERVAKPDCRFFELALQRFGLSAPETFFVDDKEANVQAARSVGIPGTVFRGAALLREQLLAAGVALGPYGNCSSHTHGARAGRVAAGDERVQR